MTIYLYLALILAIIGFLIWFGKKMQSIGEKKGYEKCNTEWQGKVDAMYHRYADKHDDGTGVSGDDSVWKGSDSTVKERVES